MPPSLPPNSLRPRRLPLLPLAAAALVVLGLLMVAQWAWQQRQATASGDVTLTSAVNNSGNPFGAMVALRERDAAARKMQSLRPRRVATPPPPADQLLGNAEATVVVTVLLDPANGAQRTQAEQWMAVAMQQPKVRIEQRYAPASNSVAGGMAWALAQRFGRQAEFWQLLAMLPGNQSDADMLSLLLRLGIPANRVRAELNNPASPALLQANLAAAWAKQEGLSGPLLLLDGLVVDGIALHPELLATYLQRLIKQEDLIQLDDLLLMRRQAISAPTQQY